MGTRRNRKNRKRKTKRKLIKGDPITFLKSLKTPEQIRKHSLFKKRTVKRRNMRGGGEKETRKTKIKNLIKKINDEYKTTKWNLDNIETQYEKNKKEYNDGKFLKDRFINTNERKTSNDESISDKLSICSKWNNVRKKNYTGKSGPYLDDTGTLQQGNLSAKEALACAYWSYHKIDKSKQPSTIRRIEIIPTRETDVATGVYFPPSFLEAAGYQYNKFDIENDTKEAKEYESKSEQEKKTSAENAAKAKLEAEKSAAIAADCETNYDPTTKKEEKYCIGYLIKGKDYTDRITIKYPKTIPSVTMKKKISGIILGHLNYGTGDTSEKWNGPSSFSDQVKKYTKLMSTHQSNPNLYIVLYFKGNKKKLTIGIFGEAELNNDIDDWNNNMKETIENLLEQKFKNRFDDAFVKKNDGPQNYTKLVKRKDANIDDKLNNSITDSIQLLGSIGNEWKKFLRNNWDNGSLKMRKYLSEKTYNISDIIMLIKKK